MSAGPSAARHASDFVGLLQEFLAASCAFARVFDAADEGADLSFAALAGVVGDDEGSVLYRLKQRSHALFRSEHFGTAAVRREALFDLTVGSLFHEALKLRETLYQREVYAPRVASLRAASDDDEADALFGEFERLLTRSSGSVGAVIAEVRILLVQTREQFRRLLIERAGERGVTRCLLGRRDEVDLVFAEGFHGVLEEMHGDVTTGLLEAAHGLLDSAYFVEAGRALREAEQVARSPLPDVTQLQHYAEGMQAFLEGDYPGAIAALEAWVDLRGHDGERALSQRAAAALGRVGRLVENDAAGTATVDAAKQLQLRLDAGVA